jgi:hypothetical protein
MKLKGTFRQQPTGQLRDAQFDDCPECTLSVIADISLPVGKETEAKVILEEEPPTATRKTKAYRLVVKGSKPVKGAKAKKSVKKPAAKRAAKRPKA